MPPKTFGEAIHFAMDMVDERLDILYISESNGEYNIYYHLKDVPIGEYFSVEHITSRCTQITKGDK